MRLSRIAFACVLLVCIPLAIHQLHRPSLVDFQVYETAGALVHQGMSIHIYDDADTGLDPQERFASHNTELWRASQKLGIGAVRLYVYPPLLADLMVPFGSIPDTRQAAFVWLAANGLAILLSAWMVTLLLGVRAASAMGGLILLSLLSMFATFYCLSYGQITILLLLLWCAGIDCYRRNWRTASAALLAVATAIKLTPLIVVVPLLIWAEWKWLRDYCSSLVLIGAAMLWINGPATCLDYFRHVMPAMAGGIPDFENKSLVAAVEIFYVALRGGTVGPVTMSIPHGILLIGKAASAISILTVSVLVFRSRSRVTSQDRVLTLALFALLSACVAPVSWKHAYVVQFLALALLWAEVFQGSIPKVRLAWLTFASVELGSYFFDAVGRKLLHAGPAAGAVAFLVPATGLLLIVTELARMPKQQRCLQVGPIDSQQLAESLDEVERAYLGTSHIGPLV